MTYDFGSISSGTMRPEDLIPAFADELRAQVEAAAPHPGAMNPDHVKLCDEADSIEDYASEDADCVLEELFDALSEYAPPYGYFGAHLSDGADYGFWLQEDFQQAMRDDDVLEVTDTSEVPADYSGEVLHVNDHGNATFYAATHGKLREVWSIV